MKTKLLPLLFIILLLTGCANSTDDKKDAQAENSQESQSQEASQESQTQEAAPYILTFEASTIEGEELTSECFADSRLTMINVWATYCNPCLNEMPDLGEIAASYDAADFQLIGIVSDVIEGGEEDEINNAKNLIEETGADYPHLLLNESLYKNLVGAVDAVPMTFFINQEGEMLGYVTGAQSKETWEEIINGLLEEME